MKIISTDPEPLRPTNLFRQPEVSDTQNNEQEISEQTVAQRLEGANNNQEDMDAPISQTYENNVIE